jgi:hypothetical protein
LTRQYVAEIQEVTMDRLAFLACLVLGAMAFVVAEPLEAG